MGITLPAACLRLLGVARGGTVQVVPHPSGKVIIAPMHLRVGAQQELAAAGREVLYLRRQVSRLRKRLMTVPARSVARGVSIGYAKAWQKELMDLSNHVAAMRVEQAGFLEWQFQNATRPVLTPPPASIEGGDVASGGHPPGHPSES